jgi:hypothetical protein
MTKPSGKTNHGVIDGATIGPTATQSVYTVVFPAHVCSFVRAGTE